MDGASAILAVIGFTAATARNVLGLLSDIRDAPDDIGDLAADLQNLALLLKSAGELCSKHRLQAEDAPIVETLTSCLGSCQDTMNAMQMQLKSFLGKGGGRRSPLRAISWAMRKGEIRSLRSRLRDAKASLHMAVTVLNGHLTNKAQEDIRKDMATDYERLLAEFQSTDRARRIRARLEDDLTSVSASGVAMTRPALSVAGETDAGFPIRKFFQSYVPASHLEVPSTDSGLYLETLDGGLDDEVPQDPLILIRASREVDCEMVRHCLSLGLSPDQRAPDGRTALHFAAMANSSEMATILMDNGADANAKDNSQLTPFNICIAMRSIETATVLAKKGCELGDFESGLFNILRNANGSVQVQELLEVLHDRIREEKGTDGGKYLLLDAIDQDEMAVLQALLEAGFSMDIRKNGITPLHQAILEERKTALELLLQHGSNPNEYLPKETIDILDKAVPWQRPLMEYLGNGITAIGNAGRVMKNVDMVHVLLDAGADPNFAYPDGGADLQGLCANEYFPTAKLLVEHGADPNHQDGCGLGPMYWAAACGNLELLQLLLAKGGKVNLQATEEWSNFTPLHGAALNHRPAVVRVLVDAGADLSIKDLHGRRAAEVHSCRDPNCNILKALASLSADQSSDHSLSDASSVS